MKRRKTSKLSLVFIATVIVCATVASTMALAMPKEYELSSAETEASIIKVQCPDYFTFNSVDVSTDGEILLCGSSGKPSNSVATMVCCDKTGKNLWTIEDETSIGYRRARFIDGSGIVVLRSAPGYGEYGHTVNLISEEKLVWRSELMSQTMFDILPLTDGLLASGKVDSSLARIARFDMKGAIEWQLLIDEPINFTGLMSHNDIHVAFGSKTVTIDDIANPPISVVIAFDDYGKVLWRHDSTASEEYTDGIFTENGEIILIGNCMVGNEYPFFIRVYNSSGEMLNSNSRYFECDGYKGGYILSLAQTPTGYIGCARISSPNAMGIVYFDSDYQITSMRIEQTGFLSNINSVSLNPIGDELFLIINGRAEYDEALRYEDDFSLADIPRSSIIKRITASSESMEFSNLDGF